MDQKWKTIVLLSTAELLAMSLWFSATAVAPPLMDHWNIGSGQAAWLTMSVQLGFVTGAVVSALLNIPDLWEPRKVVAAGAASGAMLNAVIPALEPGFAAAVALRFGTGMALAAVYPVGMKIMATWTKHDRGLGLGLMVGALTVGSASPHLVRAFGGLQSWHGVMYAASGFALAGALIAWHSGRLGPYRAEVPPFAWRQIGRALSVRSLRLANFGYLGHMWELYAMWTWIPVFFLAAFNATERGPVAVTEAAIASFVTIAAGGAGSIAAGHLADRWGRTRTTMLSMIISGSCALAIGWWVDGHPIIVTSIAVIWGFAIVADSAQFSTSVSELSDPEYMGTQLTMQTSMGFLLTLASIQVTPLLVEWGGWRWAFGLLAIGPALGTWAMWTLGRSPDAARLAGGRG